MRKIFNKVLAVATSMTLIATMAIGAGVVNPATVKADESPVTLQPWSAYQAGQKIFNQESGWDAAYYNSFATGSESFSFGEAENTVTAKSAANGFVADIKTNGWDAQWANTNGWNYDKNGINPWMLTVDMKNIPVEAGHIYQMSFKAKASSAKYAYINGGVTYDDGNTGSIFEGNEEKVEQLLAIGTEEKTYSFEITNWVGAKSFDFSMMLGAFNGELDFAGNPISIGVLNETNWAGTVEVSEFTIIDKGLDPEYTPEPPKPTVDTQPSTTKSDGTNVTQPNGNDKPTAGPKKLAKVKKLKVKNKKKGTIKITWKKVTNAKKYQVKVGKKSYTTKKATKTVKKLKKGKKYTIKVRAKAPGYKTSAWATKKKFKIKK